MKHFYETYAENDVVSPLVTQISWTADIMKDTCYQNMCCCQKALKDFILELGKDFTFIDEEYKFNSVEDVRHLLEEIVSAIEYVIAVYEARRDEAKGN